MSETRGEITKIISGQPRAGSTQENKLSVKSEFSKSPVLLGHDDDSLHNAIHSQ